MLGRATTGSDVPLQSERQAAIRRFVQAYVDQTPMDYSSPAHARLQAESYDLFVAGSDQIWHPNNGLRDHFRFLTFVEPRKRLAYAASFGAPDVPKSEMAFYRKGLAGFFRISVREQRAAELVSQISGRIAPVVLDPTMLLPPGTWEDLAVIPSSLAGGGYVAEFVLGERTAEDEMRPVVQYAAKAGFRLVDLKEDFRGDLSAMGPLEFIGAIRNASLLVTDSFHAAVFAITFHVPFLLRGRGEMNSRLDTLLDKCGIAQPRWSSCNEIHASIDIDWDYVGANLCRERQSSLAILRESLSPTVV